MTQKRGIVDRVIVIAVVAVITAGILIAIPVAKPGLRAQATILRFGVYDTDNPLPQPTMAIVVHIDGVGLRTLIERESLLNRCQIGDSIVVLGNRLETGGIVWRLPLTSCSPLPPAARAR